MKHGVACKHASSLGHSGGGAGKGRRACNYISGIWCLHQKGRCKMLIGVDDTTNNVTTLGTFFFSMFFYIRTLFCFILIGGNLTAQFTGSHRGIHGRIQIPSTSSSSAATRASWWDWLQVNHDLLMTSFLLSEYWSSKTLQTIPVSSPPFQTTVSCYLEACSQSKLWSSQFHITIA